MEAIITLELDHKLFYATACKLHLFILLLKPNLFLNRPASDVLEIVTYYYFRISHNFHLLFFCA